MRNGQVCLFQTATHPEPMDVVSLAWFTKHVRSGTSARIDWTADYLFSWSRQGSLTAGLVYKSSQTWSADLTNRNAIDFVKEDYMDAYTFQNQTSGPEEGYLFISQNRHVSADECAVGIGMSGSSTFVANSQPNMRFTFESNTQLWIAFGDFQQGEVLDIAKVTPSAQKITFTADQYSINAVLQKDDTWAIS